MENSASVVLLKENGQSSGAVVVVVVLRVAWLDVVVFAFFVEAVSVAAGGKENVVC